MAIRTVSFPCGNATVTVREPKGIDRIDVSTVFPKLVYDRSNDRDRNRVMKFADMILRTVSIEGDMGFAWASADSDAATLQKAYAAWLEWPDDVTAVWIGNLWMVAQPPAEPATQPDADPNV